MLKQMNDSYLMRIKSKSRIRFLIGLSYRFLVYLKNEIIISIANLKGAKVGSNSIIPFTLAMSANKNLIVGNNTIINSTKIDLRQMVEVGSHVIIGQDVEILRGSHNIDSADWEYDGNDLIIKDYVWLANSSVILPSCKEIGYGAVCGAFAVVSSAVDDSTVVVGNPAKAIRSRNDIHKNLIVEALRAGDFIKYWETRINN